MVSYSIQSRGGIRNFSLTTKIIFLNVLFYFVSLILLAIYGEEFFLNNLALTPSLILSGKSLWTFITSIFVHGSFFHLFANMFSLYFVGGFLEKLIGKKRFFWVYFISGIFGGIFYILASMFFGNLLVPAVGASGAIFGLLGVLAVLVPYSRIYLIAGPLILIVLEVLLDGILPANLLGVVTVIFNILIILMIFSLFSFRSSFRKIALPIELPMWSLPFVAIIPLSIIGLFVSLPIGNSAHFGGLVVGVLYGFYLRKKYPRKTNQIRRAFK
jgi:membrane associated rhomboid family serine protease